jgi:hypothetical protein
VRWDFFIWVGHLLTELLEPILFRSTGSRSVSDFGFIPAPAAFLSRSLARAN